MSLTQRASTAGQHTHPHHQLQHSPPPHVNLQRMSLSPAKRPATQAFGGNGAGGVVDSPLGEQNRPPPSSSIVDPMSPLALSPPPIYPPSKVSKNDFTHSSPSYRQRSHILSSTAVFGSPTPATPLSANTAVANQVGQTRAGVTSTPGTHAAGILATPTRPKGSPHASPSTQQEKQGSRVAHLATPIQQAPSQQQAPHPQQPQSQQGGLPPPIPSPSLLAANGSHASTSTSISASSASTTSTTTTIRTPHKHAPGHTRSRSHWQGALSIVTGGTGGMTSSASSTHFATPLSPGLFATTASSPTLGPMQLGPHHARSGSGMHSSGTPTKGPPPHARHGRSASALMSFSSPLLLHSPVASPSTPSPLPSPASSPRHAPLPLSLSLSLPPSSIDRYIPSRRDLARAISLHQAEANQLSYEGVGGASSVREAKENPKPLEVEGVKGTPEEAAAALHQADFKQQLASSLLQYSPSATRPDSLFSFHPSSACPSPSSASTPRSSPKLSPSSRAAPHSGASASSAQKSGRGRGIVTPRTLFPGDAGASGSIMQQAQPQTHLQQLRSTYRTPATAAGASETYAFTPSSLTSPLRSPLSRPLHSSPPPTSSLLGLSPSTDRSLERSLVSRASSLNPDPIRVLDCPGLANDYYLNLLHWSGRQDILAIGLGTTVYLWNAVTKEIHTLCPEEWLDQDEETAPTSSSMVTALRWNEEGSRLAVGYGNAQTMLWDVTATKVVQKLESHTARVSALDWNSSRGIGGGANLLASGGLDSTIRLHDVRISTSPDNIVARFDAHREEVCGLAFSPDGTQLASGANDNRLCIWNLNASLAASPQANSASSSSSSGHLNLTHHSAAVKALAWCPWQDRLLASGGGLADGHIRFCNSVTGQQVGSVHTYSQVCSLAWSPTGERELLSAHGHPHQSLMLWKFGGINSNSSHNNIQASPTRGNQSSSSSTAATTSGSNSVLKRVATLKGHEARVLHTAVSPDGSTVVSASADETLRFWKVWKPSADSKKHSAGSSSPSSKLGFFGSSASSSSSMRMQLR